ncbi:MAG: MATE family efflux transporter, partial [Erysipelotrichaceae bacterium]|nr:MATE family efflux transporter [Erysipelotrichaceae bacterium]
MLKISYFLRCRFLQDSIVVGRAVGVTALAAVTSCSDISQVIIGFFTGLSVGAGVAFSRYFGAGNRERLHESIHTSLTFAMIMGMVMLTIGELLSPLLLRIVSCPADVYPEAMIYLRIYLIGIIFTSMYNVQAGVLRSVGD